MYILYNYINSMKQKSTKKEKWHLRVLHLLVLHKLTQNN